MKPAFDVTTQMRGLEYFRGRRVEQIRGDANRVEAMVRGEHWYRVVLEWVGADLEMQCECPVFQSERPCKHLWATGLQAAHIGYLSGAGEPEVEMESTKPLEAWIRRGAGKTGSRKKVELVYLLDLATSRVRGQCALQLQIQEVKLDGSRLKARAARLDSDEIAQLGEEDREIVALLLGARPASFYGYGVFRLEQLSGVIELDAQVEAMVLQRVVRTGRAYRKGETNLLLEWPEAGDWELELGVVASVGGEKWKVEAWLVREGQRVGCRDADLVTHGGVVVRGVEMGRLMRRHEAQWARHWMQNGGPELSETQVPWFVEKMLRHPLAPRMAVPERWQLQEVQQAGRPWLRVWQDDQARRSSTVAELGFEYRNGFVGLDEESVAVVDWERREFVRRDREAEAAALKKLIEIGARPVMRYSKHEERYEVAASRVAAMLQQAMELGWKVEAEGKVMRRPGSWRTSVSSGTDWFDLRAEVDYDGVSADLPALLEAMRKGKKLVELGDGSYGMLPEEWLKQFGLLAEMGEAVEGAMRYRRGQGLLLDVLLAGQGKVDVDAKFRKLQRQLREFEGIREVREPRGFVGELRGYQREGLGWMEFLRRLDLGGCLADDMGVGKTPQVLAMLEGRRGKSGPSLVVAPRSVIYNWMEEARRFTPKLRVLDFSGMGRQADEIPSHDLVLTTYGTLRRDVDRLMQVEFDYVVLDEAQTVKNHATESAKAVRLLKGRHRLALSGTPIENHLGELWSLFEFLNPGMLGSESRLREAASKQMLGRMLRPLILRRTKAQVVKELPEKTEQTLYCELEGEQRRIYNDLRNAYRKSVLERVAQQGMGRARMHVLEGLLRLRQAACHVGLIERQKMGVESAKLEALAEQLAEVVESGHKALVFSQFTQLLAIVEKRLRQMKLDFEYLDGKTKNRQQRVERFQNEPQCKVFLISLKAGGVGLNLTAAEYVFLLDPWWNPAVEAQAVDRAHRIGQRQAVFAYRMIARDTVEEKMLELQKTKRELVESILGEGTGLIRDLKLEDLELLFS